MPRKLTLPSTQVSPDASGTALTSSPTAEAGLPIPHVPLSIVEIKSRISCMVPEALMEVATIMRDSSTTARVRLEAAMWIIDMASRPDQIQERPKDIDFFAQLEAQQVVSEVEEEV